MKRKNKDGDPRAESLDPLQRKELAGPEREL